MIPLDQARRSLADSAQRFSPTSVAIQNSLGCILASVVTSRVDLPPADVSAMDGYAARFSDIRSNKSLPVAFEVAAGRGTRDLAPGAAARIFTGAPLPGGSDTIIPQEDAETLADGTVDLHAPHMGAHVRRQGEVIAVGTEIASPGAQITPAAIASFAACGVSEVEVVPRPRIAAIVTGDEIVPAGQPTGSGQIRDSNGPLLAALAKAAGLEPPELDCAGDTAEALVSSISRALSHADLVLTTGGVSVGDYDLVPEVVRQLGGEVLFHRVRMKPGKPIFVASVGEKWLIGLPGNPLAVLTGWRLFVWPLVATLSGAKSAFEESPIAACLETPVQAPRSRTEFRPALLTQRGASATVKDLGWKGSHDVRTAAEATALARFEPGESYSTDSVVPCFPLSSGGIWPYQSNGTA